MTQTYDRAQMQRGWDEIAEGFDTHVTPYTLKIGEQVLSVVELGNGMTFLDVGSGSGALSLPAARHGAEVTAVDSSPRMIELLDDRATEAGLRVRGEVMDACDLGFENGTFDVVSSLNGVSVLPDSAVAISEMARVTKPGGQVQVIAFGRIENQEWFTVFLGTMSRSFDEIPGPGDLPPPPPFQFADPSVLRERLADAGLDEIRVTSMPLEFSAEPTDGSLGRTYWDFMLSSNPIAVQLMAPLSEAQRNEAVEILDGVLQQRGDNPTLGVEFNIGLGTKPR